MYRGCRGGPQNNTLPGFVHRFTIPDHPYLAADVATARSQRIVPPRRDAAGNVVVAVPTAPAPAPAPAPPAVTAPATTAPVVVAGTATAGPAVVTADVGIQTTPEIAPTAAPTSDATPPSHPENLYSFPYWPPQPWDPEPDMTGIPSHIELRDEDEEVKVRARTAWMRSKPLMWREDETEWHGARYLADGSYGAAGLWVRVDSTGNIVDVSTLTRCES